LFEEKKELSEMSNELVQVEYFNGHPVRFQKGNAYVNITSMCKAFPGKRPVDFIRLQDTQEYAAELEKMVSQDHHLVNGRAYYSERGRTGGIWAHRQLALRCAYWCSKELAIWCDAITLKLLSGEATLQPANPSPAPVPTTPVLLNGSLVPTFKLEWIEFALATEKERIAALQLAENTRTIALEVVREKKAEVVQLQTKLEEAAPKVDFHDKVVALPGQETLAKTAKMIGMGRQTMVDGLREKSVFFKNGEPLPRQTYINAGYFVVKEGRYHNSAGQLCFSGTTLVTPKGISFICRLFNIPDPSQQSLALDFTRERAA
jgi:phage antirepressor YoqD-like protein